MRRRLGNVVPGSGLCAFEHEKLEVLAVIVDWDTPFAIVILKHQRIIDADPGAPFNCCTALPANCSFRSLAGYADCVVTRSREEVSSIALCSVRYKGQCIA